MYNVLWQDSHVLRIHCDLILTHCLLLPSVYSVLYKLWPYWYCSSFRVHIIRKLSVISLSLILFSLKNRC